MKCKDCENYGFVKLEDISGHIYNIPLVKGKRLCIPTLRNAFAQYEEIGEISLKYRVSPYNKACENFVKCMDKEQKKARKKILKKEQRYLKKIGVRTNWVHFFAEILSEFIADCVIAIIVYFVFFEMLIKIKFLWDFMKMLKN